VSDNPNTPTITVTVEQLFKLVQQHIRLWSQPDGLEKVYVQAIQLAQHISLAFNTHPGKITAQLHHHKPHYDFTTNLTLKAAIFATIQVSKQSWSDEVCDSVIAATLTTNVAILPLLNKQSKGTPLSDKNKAALVRGTLLSYKLLKQSDVPDPLWLRAISAAIPPQQNKTYATDLTGTIIRNAYRFAKPLCRQQAVQNTSVTQVFRQICLDNSHFGMRQMGNNASRWLHGLGEGALVMLQNNQLALIMHNLPQGGYVVFLFPAQTVTAKGRFVVIANKHIASSQPCFECQEPRLYSLIWDAPLERFAAEKEIDISEQPIVKTDIFTPPKMLSGLIDSLFETPNLNKISETIKRSEQLTQLLITTASQVANKDIEITDPKHALAMLGLNRIGPLLILGALMDVVVEHQFPGFSQVHNRQQCFIQALKYYTQLTDLNSPEELSMYAVFWIAPLYVTKELQASACELNQQKSIDPLDAFSIENLFGAKITESHKLDVIKLAKNWNLPPLCLELFRQINKPDTTIKPAKKVINALALIRLTAFHTHTIFNQVDVNSAFLQQKLMQHLEATGIKLPQFLAHQEKFLSVYSPYTPLI
jgi:hypothetical protein